MDISSLSPYAFETPRVLLTRRFHLYTHDMAAGSVYYDNPLVTLLAHPTIQQIVKNFYYIRTSVKIHIIVSASIFMYGWIGVVPFPMNARTRPQYTAGTALEEFDTWSMFGAILSIQDSENLELTLTWPSPAFFYPVRSLPTIWTVGIMTGQIESASAEVAPSCQIQVYGELIDTDLVGQVFDADVSSGYEMQSGQYRYGRLFGQAYEAAYTHGPSVVKGLGAGASAALAGEKIYEKVTQAKNAKEVFVTLQELQEGVHPDQGNRTAVRPNFYGNMGSFNPGNDFQSISDRPGSTIPNKALVSCTKDMDFNKMIRQWALIYRSSFTKDASQSNDELYIFLAHPQGGGRRAHDDDLSNPILEPGYLSYCSYFWKFWRGSIEFKIVVFSPMIVSARVNYLINWRKDTIPDSADGTYVQTRAGYMKSDFVAIKGTTEIFVTIPFMRQHMYDRMDQAEGVSALCFSITAMEPSLKTATPISLPFLVFKRAGSDFEFRQFDGGLTTMEHVDGYQMQMINEEWDGPQNFVGNINTLSARMSRGKDQTIGIPGQLITGAMGEVFTRSWLESSLVDKMSMLSLYYSGTTAYKFVFDPSQNLEFIGSTYPSTKRYPVLGVSDTGYYHIECGTAMTDQNTFKMIETEVPFESKYPMYFTAGYAIGYGISPPLEPVLHSKVNFDEVPVPQTMFESVRPDFSFIMPIPPPNKLEAYTITNYQIGPPSGFTMQSLEEDKYIPGKFSLRGMISLPDFPHILVPAYEDSEGDEFVDLSEPAFNGRDEWPEYQNSYQDDVPNIEEIDLLEPLRQFYKRLRSVEDNEMIIRFEKLKLGQDEDSDFTAYKTALELQEDGQRAKWDPIYPNLLPIENDADDEIPFAYDHNVREVSKAELYGPSSSSSYDDWEYDYDNPKNKKYNLYYLGDDIIIYEIGFDEHDWSCIDEAKIYYQSRDHDRILETVRCKTEYTNTLNNSVYDRKRELFSEFEHESYEMQSMVLMDSFTNLVRTDVVTDTDVESFRIVWTTAEIGVYRVSAGAYSTSGQHSFHFTNSHDSQHFRVTEDLYSPQIQEFHVLSDRYMTFEVDDTPLNITFYVDANFTGSQDFYVTISRIMAIGNSLPQPLWVSNYKVSDDPDGVTSPVQITFYNPSV